MRESALPAADQVVEQILDLARKKNLTESKT
jgi:hypothetical protein